MSDNQKRIDQILRELDQVGLEEQKSDAETLVGKTKSFFNPFRFFWVQITASAHYLWDKVFRHVWNVLHYLGFGIVWKYFRKFWDRFAFRTEDGKRVFSKVRGAVILFCTGLFLYFAVSILSLMWHSTLYVTTARLDETVYLSNAQEIDADGNIFSVQGCEYITSDAEEFSCSENESLYFRIEPTAFGQLWSVWNKGTLFYPDYIAAPIAPGWQKCVITSYGFRIKTLIRRYEVYPELLSARCGPI